MDIKTIEAANRKCLRCHSLTTLGYKSAADGLYVDLSVDPAEFHASNHGKLACVTCHTKAFQTFPHTAALRRKQLVCLDCHKKDHKLLKFQFPGILREFQASVHVQKLGKKFTCFSCHDPHSFKIHARLGREVAKTVLYDNRICLQCHSNEPEIIRLSGSGLPSLDQIHAWLPHKDLHWANVRCIDCHTAPSNMGVSHQILPKERAVRDCVRCHSSNSLLLQSLYKFQARQARSRDGFLNATVLNHSYVIGATRNYYLNIVSFVVFGMTVAGIALHAGLRRYFTDKRRAADAKRRSDERP